MHPANAAAAETCRDPKAVAVRPCTTRKCRCCLMSLDKQAEDSQRSQPNRKGCLSKQLTYQALLSLTKHQNVPLVRTSQDTCPLPTARMLACSRGRVSRAPLLAARRRAVISYQDPRLLGSAARITLCSQKRLKDSKEDSKEDSNIAKIDSKIVL